LFCSPPPPPTGLLLLLLQVATFIVQKILLDDVGLNYICATADRFFGAYLQEGCAVSRQLLLRGLSHPYHHSGPRLTCSCFVGAWQYGPDTSGDTITPVSVQRKACAAALTVRPPPHSSFALAATPTCSLLKHIIRCYLRLSDNARAREALRNCLPDVLKDPSTFANTLKSDVVAQRWLLQLLRTVYPEDAAKFAA
jgi:hypothetical protein